MNKLFTFLASAALIGSLSACSSDEPTKGPDKGEIEEGTSFYLKVRVSDANSVSRADGDAATEPGEKDDIVEDGNKSENTLSHASFYFFDANKVFITKARILNPNENKPVDDENGNIELETDNVIVLQGLKKDNFPKYMVTVLNAPGILDSYVTGSAHTLSEVRDFCEGLTYEAEDGNFVMSTSSFFVPGTDIHMDATILDGNALVSRYEPGVYGANVVEQGDFIEVKKGEAVPDLNNTTGNIIISVYVERLAAKFTVTTPNDKRIFKVRNYTIAGLPNTDIDETGKAGTPVWVKIENFGVTGTEANSHLSKDISGYDATTPWSRWNDMSYHRSYWGKSVNYGNSSAVYVSPKFATINKADNKFVPVYSNETTNTVANISNNSILINNKVTNFVVTAGAYSDADCTKPLDLVLYSGTYFTKEQFVLYVLSTLNNGGKLNYYTKKSDSSETEGGTLNKDNYTQISSANFKFEYNDGGTGKFIMTTTIGSDTDLYALTFDKDDKLIAETKVENAVATINKDIDDIFKSNGYPTAYTGGAMTYFIPVEHLLNNDGKVTHEGQFGVVRNHWYQLEIDKIMNLGHGVFDPDGTTNETLIPDDESSETYALGARIKILSWKIVKQSVDL